MEEPHRALAVCFRLCTTGLPSIAAQELNEAIAGAQPRAIMTQITSGDSVLVAFCLSVVRQMETAVIFRLLTGVKYTLLAPLRMKAGLGAPQLSTMTLINSGATVEGTRLVRFLSLKLLFHPAHLTVMESAWTHARITVVSRL